MTQLQGHKVYESSNLKLMKYLTWFSKEREKERLENGFIRSTKGLLAIGNLLFLAGIGLGLGLVRTYTFFFQKKKMKGTICFFFGIFLVIVGRTIFGLAIEAFGFINLFGDAFPIVIAILRKLPIIGNILNHPTINNWLNRTDAGSELPF
ncbi:golgi transport protein 1 [Heterostelium album PN500]|uniref:Golgi transport protein 1 n=1 Tax=Heterostelium pallidum (strain ATCC 26659 / Pp 5 / PN500) TaxID=670386 RepID=D3BJ79_HETP5|nr:golgi transport protein 1 [Heterostelium album PN500]EFA77959.1 golgi transport protein 1 [Heterostelium album PN500]|eukprot:XP_020430087.1 golgi transport protein 1 [Heterostelium album PN500]